MSVLVFDYPGEPIRTIDCADSAAVLAGLEGFGDLDEIAGIHEALTKDSVWHDEGGCIKLFATGGKALTIAGAAGPLGDPDVLASQ